MNSPDDPNPDGFPSSSNLLSEILSENALSDDDDVKSNINPYFNSPNTPSGYSATSSVADATEQQGYDFNYRNTTDFDNSAPEHRQHNLHQHHHHHPQQQQQQRPRHFNEGDDMHFMNMPKGEFYQNSQSDYYCEMPDIKYPPHEMMLNAPASTQGMYGQQHPQQQHHQQQSVGRFGPPCQPYGHSYQPPHAQFPGQLQRSNMWYGNAPYGALRGNCDMFHYGYAPMVDMLQLSNSGREARNRAEKNRRDKLNGSIQELSTMVPHVAESPRRVDKTAILRFAAHGLRLKYVFGKSSHRNEPRFTDSLMKLLDSFFITLTCSGQIVLISSSIEQHLGHCQADLYGQNILQITHPEDHNLVKNELIPTDLDNLFDADLNDCSSEPRQRTPDEEEYIDQRLLEDKRSFTIRLARAGPRSEPTQYEVVRIDGSFRRSDDAPRGGKSNNFPSTLQLIRRSRGREDAVQLHTISGNDIVLIAVARIIRPPKIVSRLIEGNSLEYKTRHLIDGRIIDCDQRIGLVAGYMTDEVQNLSPFSFMHQDDARWVIVALRQMYDCNSSFGESTYRLLSRNGNFIYLHTKGYLEIDKETNKVHSFICINTLLEEEEGKRRIEEMKRRFSIIIDTKIPQTSIDMPASNAPQQLERAIMRLIQNLPSDSAACNAIEEIPSNNHLPIMTSSNPHRSSKTPPLEFLPPEAASVKSSISKSVNVVNITAAKHLRSTQTSRTSLCESSSENNFESSSASTPSHCTCYENPEELCGFCKTCADPMSSRKRNANFATTEETDVSAPKRKLENAEIEDVLSSSLDQIGRSLHQQLHHAIELRDQSDRYEIPNSNQRLEELMIEHQKQSELYVNIKTEYEVHQHKSNIDTTATTTTSTTNSTEPQETNQQQQ